MEEKEYEPPIVISEMDGKIHISYDQVVVDIPADGPPANSVPPLARRIFEAFRCDHPAPRSAE
jgi:hypothetical protein